MDKTEFNKLLIEKFPNLKERYDYETDWLEGDESSPHLVCALVFSAYIKECLLENKDMKIFGEIFDFIEDVLVNYEDYYKGVMVVSVLEAIIHLLKDRPYVHKYFGHETIKALDELVPYFARDGWK